MKTKYNKELLEPIIRESLSWAEVIRKLGLKTTGGNYVHIKTISNYLGVDYSHFTGKLWSKGLTQDTHPSVKTVITKISRPNNEVFIQNSPAINGTRVVKRLLRLGWEYRCKTCGIDSWLGNPLTLHLDHLNGAHNDNRLENLRLLCPNCHQQTDTWGNKKRME